MFASRMNLIRRFYDKASHGSLTTNCFFSVTPGLNKKKVSFSKATFWLCLGPYLEPTYLIFVNTGLGAPCSNKRVILRIPYYSGGGKTHFSFYIAIVKPREVEAANRFYRVP